jgi:hypothetical protein
MKTRFDIPRLALSIALSIALAASIVAYTVHLRSQLSERLAMVDLLDVTIKEGYALKYPSARAAMLADAGLRDLDGLTARRNAALTEIKQAQVEGMRSAQDCAITWGLSGVVMVIASFSLLRDGLRGRRGAEEPGDQGARAA